MTNRFFTTDFDVANFQAQVLASISELQAIENRSRESIGPISDRRVAASREEPSHTDPSETRLRLEGPLDQAARLVHRTDIRARLCPALRAVSNDAFDIGKELRHC
jgi:hypothetical protein